jgi:hypothetical protein
MAALMPWTAAAAKGFSVATNIFILTTITINGFDAFGVF